MYTWRPRQIFIAGSGCTIIYTVIHHIRVLASYTQLQTKTTRASPFLLVYNIFYTIQHMPQVKKAFQALPPDSPPLRPRQWTRSLGQALGRKPPDDTDEQPQQQHQRRRHRRKQHVGADQVALPAAQNGKTPIAGASSTTTTLAAAPKATTTTTATSTTAATPADTSSTSPPACWHMQGRLTNTATGQTIALVEGVELVRSLAFETAPEKRGRGKAQEKRGSNESPSGSNTTEGKGGGREVALTKGAAAEGGQGGGEELEVDRALKPGMWTAFGALATSKFFMYQVQFAHPRCRHYCTCGYLYPRSFSSRPARAHASSDSSCAHMQGLVMFAPRPLGLVYDHVAP